MAERTNGARRHAIRDLLLEAPERSDRQIAAMLGVSPTTVGAVRAELERAGAIPDVGARLGGDGKRYRHAIGEPPDEQESAVQAEAKPQLAPEPAKPLPAPKRVWKEPSPAEQMRQSWASGGDPYRPAQPGGWIKGWR